VLEIALTSCVAASCDQRGEVLKKKKRI